MDAAFPLVETVADLVIGAAELQLPFVRVMDPVGLEVPIPQADIGGVDCQLQPLLGCLLCVFGALALGDLQHDDQDLGDSAALLPPTG